MTIDEAIRIKLAWKKTNYEPPLADEINADNLSIEALKAWKQFREGRWMSGQYTLPGETRK